MSDKVRDKLRWWVNVRMAAYSDSQYGKGELKDLLAELDSEAIAEQALQSSTRDAGPTAWGGRNAGVRREG